MKGGLARRDILGIQSIAEAAVHLLDVIKEVYRLLGASINDMNIEAS